MKTLVILLALALCLCNSQNVPGGYSQVSNADVQNSSVIQSLAQYGANAVIQAANNAGNLPNSDTNFTLTSINSVYQQVVNGINYWFNVTQTNQNNGIILNSQYIIYYQPSTNTSRIVSARWNILPHAPVPSSGSNNGSNLPGGYSLIPADQVQNSSLIQSLASIGAQTIIQQVIASRGLPTANTDFSISNINSVSSQVVNGLNYRFNVTLTNSDGVQVNGVYVINYQPATNATAVTSTSYIIYPYVQAIQPAVSSSSSSSSSSVAISTPAISAPAAAPTAAPAATNAPSSASDSSNQTIVAVSATNNETSTPVVITNSSSEVPAQAAQASQVILGGYTALSASDIQSNPAIASLAALGAQSVTQQAIADGNVPSNSVFTVSKINSVAAQVVNGINYNINVVLKNADNSTTILADYIVYYQAWTNTRRVSSLAYVVVPK